MSPNHLGTGLLDGSKKAAVTKRRLSKMAASMTLMYIFLNGLVKRCTMRTVSAARLMKNWKGTGSRCANKIYVCVCVFARSLLVYSNEF